jgi:DNA-binding LacI/PurR family transcriptional regulator
MTLTIRDVAKKANVSIATVSLAMKDDPRVAALTRKKVRRISAQLGYTPSNLGRALQSSKTRCVGYLLSETTASLFIEILKGVAEQATTKGYGVLVGITDGSYETEQRLLHLFREKAVDGILVSNWNAQSVRIMMECSQRGTPMVVCSNTSFQRTIPNIILDNKEGGRMATEHLVGLGHRQLAFCFAGVQNQRYEGCQAVAMENKLPHPISCTSEEDLFQALKARKRPTGIVAFSDLDAIQVKHVAQQAGLRIPEDLSVTGFDNLWVAALPEFNLTTIAQPQREIGLQAMEMLWLRMHGETVQSRILMPTYLGHPQ